MPRPLLFPLIFCLGASCFLSAQVVEALGTVPRNAQGLLVVRDPAGARAKLEAMLARLKEEPQKDDPLKELLSEFGLEKLPDETRGLVVAFLPQDGGQAEPVPVLVTAVGDFKAWCGELKTTTKDKVHHAFQKGDKRYITGLKGRWAFVAMAAHATALKKALAAQGSVLQELEDLPTWMMEADAAVAVTPKGFQALTAFARDSFREPRAEAGAGRGGGAPAPVDKELEAILHRAEREVILLAARVSLDEQGNLGGTLRLRLLPTGEWAGYGRTLPLPPDGGLRLLPSVPYLSALGGSLPKAWMAQLAEFGSLGLKPMLIQAGMKPDAIQAFQAKHAEAQEVIQGLGLVVPSAGLGDALPVIRLDVEDATAALDRQERFIREVGPLFKASGLGNPYEFQRLEVEGYPAGLLKTHLDRLMPQQEGVPETPPMEIGYLAPDAQTLFLGLGGLPSLAQAAAAYRNTFDRLVDDPLVKATMALLPNRAHFYAYLNAGAIASRDATRWQDRLAEELRPDHPAPTLPPVPPVGLAVHFGLDRWELMVSFPAVLQEALGTFEAANRLARKKAIEAMAVWEQEHPTSEPGEDDTPTDEAEEEPGPERP